MFPTETVLPRVFSTKYPTRELSRTSHRSPLHYNLPQRCNRVKSYSFRVNPITLHCKVDSLAACTGSDSSLNTQFGYTLSICFVAWSIYISYGHFHTSSVLSGLGSTTYIVRCKVAVTLDDLISQTASPRRLFLCRPTYGGCILV